MSAPTSAAAAAAAASNATIGASKTPTPSAASTAAAILGGSHPHQQHHHASSSGAPGAQDVERGSRAGTPSSSAAGDRSRSSSFGSQHAAGALHALAGHAHSSNHAHALGHGHHHHHSNHHHQHHQHYVNHHPPGPSHLHEQQGVEEASTAASMGDAAVASSSKLLPAGTGAAPGAGAGAAYTAPASTFASNSASTSTPSATPRRAPSGKGKERASASASASASAAAAKAEAQSDAGDASSAASPAMDAGKKPRKKKTNRACHHCQKAHLTCDESRPCQRCIKKGLQDSCHDGTRKKAKYLLEDDEADRQEALRQRGRADVVDAAQNHAHAQADIKPALNGIPAAAAAAAAETPLAWHDAGRRRSTSASASGLDASMLAFDDPTNAAAAMITGGGAIDLGEGTPGFGGFPGGGGAGDGSGPGGANGGVMTPGGLSSLSEVPFGAETSALEYSMLSFMLNGIDPALLASGSTPPLLDANGLPVADAQGNGAGAGPGAGAAYTLPAHGAAPHMGIDYGSPHLTAPMGSYQNFLPAAAPTSAGYPAAGATAPAGDTVMTAQPFADASSSAAASAPGAGGFAPSSAGAAGSKPETAKLHAADVPAGVVGGYPALEVPSPESSKNKGTPPAHASGSIRPVEADKEQAAAAEEAADKQEQPLKQEHEQEQPESHTTEMLHRAKAAAVDQHWRQRIAKIYKGDIKPFPYTEGYHFLLKWATENFSKAEVLRIVRALAIFRPSLIALQMPMAEEDETFVERSIQRTILEFEKLISFSGTPTVVWRRTCEICVVGAEFSMLTQWSREDLLGKYIYQFFDSNSTLEYWEKFALHAFENTSQSVMTTCNVIAADGKQIKCAACFSIKRDVFDLPCLIVGNFLPCLG